MHVKYFKNDNRYRQHMTDSRVCLNVILFLPKRNQARLIQYTISDFNQQFISVCFKCMFYFVCFIVLLPLWHNKRW